MWKFVRAKSQQLSAERQKLQKELFCFKKTVQHGFPYKPTSLGWDSKLRIAAIATASGAIKVFGRCGVEFYGHQKSDNAILKLLFIPNEGRIVTLSDQNTLHLWNINDTSIDEVNFIRMEGKLKKISSLYVEESNENLLVGTEGGNIYFVDLNDFVLTENILYQDIVMQNVPEGYRVHPGAVECIKEQPGNTEHLLIGYSRGVMVLWDKTNSEAIRTYMNNQQLESFCWNPLGTKFISSHNDGSYISWSTESSEPNEEPIMVYGPFPCKAITKIVTYKSANDNKDDLLIFSGGMPRASFNDHYTVTIQQGNDKHVVLDFSSKVIDFFVTLDENEGCESLIILLEEELVAIDLVSEDWKTILLPYFVSLHASAVTFLTYVNDVSESIWDSIIAVGKKQIEGIYSTMEWPINGGILKKRTADNENNYRDLILTGHEDGSVRFWNAGNTALSLLYIFKTKTYFSDGVELDDVIQNHTDDEDEWPPFRKVGCFDPFSDDPRFSIKKLAFCCKTGIIIIAGTAGQVVTCKINHDAVTDLEIDVRTINIIQEKTPIEEIMNLWKGLQRLSLKGKVSDKNDKIMVSLPSGYQPTCIVQLLPPTVITSVALQTDWNLFVVGTIVGLALYDYTTQTPIICKCTLNSNDFSTLGELPISRTKSFKKSLRESFRRIRKAGTSSCHYDKRSGTKQSPSSIPSASPEKRIRNEIALSSSPTVKPAETKPIERAVEARPVDNALGSMVRCLCFVRTTIINAHHAIPSLWAGTNNGTVYIFTINITGSKQNKNEKVTSQLGKEIQLKHRAPVISIDVINMSNKLFQCNENDNSYGPYSVIICSEEQLKIFSLPNLKPTCKLKLTATEGARIRRTALSSFSTGNHTETCLVSLTNLGECIILSIPDFRRQLTVPFTKSEDINGISTFTFTKYGEGLYLHSSCEIQRISLSTSRITLPLCSLLLPVNKHHVQSNIVDSKKEQYNSRNSIIKEEINELDCSLKKDKETVKHDVSVITIDSVKDHLSSS